MTFPATRSAGLCALLLCSAGRVTAQHQAAPFLHWALTAEAGRLTPRDTAGAKDEAEGTQPAETSTLVLAGLTGAVLGGVAAGFVGAGIGADDELEAAVIGGTIGATLAIPIAVHLANHSRGNLGLSLLASGLVGGALLTVAVASDNVTPLLFAPVTQVITSIAVEQDTFRGD